MAYKPNPNREVVNGKAKVSAKELADFQSEYGEAKTLRDLLNMDKGLTRRKDPEVIRSSTDASSSKSRQFVPARVADAPTEIQAGPKKYVDRPFTPTPSIMALSTPSNGKARSLVDQGRGVDIYKDVDHEAVLEAGLALASMYPVVRGAKMAYTAARPAIDAAAKYLSKPTGLRIKKPNFSGTKDSPAASVADDIKDPSFNPDKMTGRYPLEPEGPPILPPRSGLFFKKGGKVFSEQTRKQQKAADLGKKMASGGKVSSASSRGDGIAQRGKTKGRMC